MAIAAQMMTVSALFMDRLLKMESRGFLCYCACLWIILHILEQRIGFAQQIQVKSKLVEYKYENNMVFQA